MGFEIEIASDSGYFPWGCPEIGYSPTSDLYLLVYARYEYSITDIHAQALNPDGTPDGSDFLIGQADSVYHDLGMAYNPERDEFLVAWEKGSPTDIYGRRIKMSGGVANQEPEFLM